ncbi:hypothetical protein [Moraxella nonliquefaciens]|nr:hypothetical protein [Moraxella nonliquefaciens]QPT44919.1 hypothetical protein I6G26_02470 [Moraxella nonliquefaciens]QQC29950.1 hypothetical protein I6H63_01250 [Moraxella nonliquefaciens]
MAELSLYIINITGKDQNPDQQLKGNDIPQDVIKHFGLNPKKVKKL